MSKRVAQVPGNPIWYHNKCHQPVELHADNSAWCTKCKCNVQLEERTEFRGAVRRPRG